MIQPPEDRRPPLTPQLALRVAIIGGVALALFAIIFFRLWYLQVLSGQQYAKAASVNFVRKIDVPAPRGEIVASDGTVLVDSEKALDVQISPGDLPVPIGTANLLTQPPRDVRIYRRLARVLRISNKRIHCKVVVPIGGGVVDVYHRRLARIPCDVAQQVGALAYANVTIKEDVSRYVQYYLAERQNYYQGVDVIQVYRRHYPLGGLAAQLFGTVGPINAAEVKERRFRGVSHNAIIGQSGLEAEYNPYLEGTDGSQKIQVNSLGQFQQYLKGIAPTPGHNLELSLDVQLQRVGQAALAQSIASNPPSNGGAFVAMNPDSGEIYAMGSLPTFNPNIFAKPFLPQSVYNQLNNAASNYPLFNRAIDGGGPTGSTFKPITATAALQSGDWNLSDTYDDTGQFCFPGTTDCLHNAGMAANGVLDLVNAIRVSDDVFFYNLGLRMNEDVPRGGPLQHWARLFGIGEPTGVDVPGEASGTLPTPAWRAGRNRLEAYCDNLTHPTSLFPHHPHHKLPPGGCGLADGTNRPWSEGDNVNLAVGQGDVQVTPLQLAVAYSAIANGGTVVKPHVGLAITDSEGTVLRKIQPPPTRHINIDPAYLDAIRTGMNEAAQAPGGTSDAVFGNFPEKVYGKTGTAQYTGQQDYSWYSCFVPASATSKPIEVVVWVQQGGFGAVAAAPVAREILSQWFFGNPGAYVAGTSRTL